MAELQARRTYRSLLMVGTHLESTGGIRAVVQGYVDGGLFDRFDCVYVATHRSGGYWIKAVMAVRAWAQVAYRLATLDSPLVHVMLSIRASIWRKSVVCLLARAFLRPYLLHVHSGRFVAYYEDECSRAAQWFIRDLLSHAALLIALSEEARAGLLRICPSARVEVLPNAVAARGRSCAQSQRRDDTLLFLGDVTRAKGVFDLVEAVGRVREHCPRVSLVCGGRGAVADVRRAAADLGASSHIICTGWLDAARKREALAAATMFVLPSYSEGIPMALLEAMSAGLPVIASNVGGIPQVVKDGVNGLLIEPGDISGLAAAISRLLATPALRERLGNAARSTVEHDFALDRVLARLTSIYTRLGLEPRMAAAGP